MDASATCTDADKLHQVLELSFGAGAWSLLDVCCMCASSLLLRSTWLQLLRQHPSPAWLLTGVADVASAKTPVNQAKATAVLKWLMEECLPGAALAHHPSVPAGLLTIPNIQQQLAEQLCRYGVQFSYQEVVAAARRRVPGVGVWVLAQIALGIDAGVPAAAEMVCKGMRFWLPWDLDITVDAMCDIVHLGVNSGNQDAASVAAALLNARLLSTRLSPGQALDLLYTAVDRHQDKRLQPSFNPVSVLCSIVDSLRNSHSLDGVSAAQLLPLLQHALHLDGVALRSAAPPYGGERATRVYALVQQPAYDQLTPEQLAALLEVVVEADDACNFHVLTMGHPDGEWPAFTQLDAATVASLIMLAVKVAGRGQITDSKHNILKGLWRSQAARQLREDGCQPLLPVLLSALSVWPGVDSMFTKLVRSVRRSISSTVVLELLTAALEAGNEQAFDFLWSQDARARLNVVDLRQLLCIASRSGTCMLYVKGLLHGHPAWDASCTATEDKLAAQQLPAD